jgi:hypothetical protein
MIGQLAQIAGSLLILVPFGLAQLGRLEARSRAALLLNLAGSSILAADAAVGSQWGFLLPGRSLGRRLGHRADTRAARGPRRARVGLAAMAQS